MVGLGSNPQPQQNPQQLNQTSTMFFNKGEEVEVSSEEEGFRGAWYLATILEFPTVPQSTIKSASKKKRKAIVQYKTLVTEDGTAPLVEQVDPQLIRPLPPQDSLKSGGFFQENEAIDARLKDGWWSGVVKKVLEWGARYMVYLDNPPDILYVDAKDLRTHLDWVDGKWVRPGMKQQATGSVFSSGTEVEVRLEEDNARDIWLPAVVIKEFMDKTFVVKCQSSWNSDKAETMERFVDSLHIRPTPPHADRNYELLERVDAHNGIGWRSGVITKILAGRRYNVFFKQANENRELHQSKIRPHLEWVDGKWISEKGQRKRIEMARLKSGWTLLMTNLILEIASAVCDQLGYALVGMVLAFVALLLSTAELIHMARRERMSLLPTFHRPSTTLAPEKPVGTIVEYFGLVGAVWQCIYSTVEYAYARQKKDNPINMCLLPSIFLLCVVISNLMKKSYIAKSA